VLALLTGAFLMVGCDADTRQIVIDGLESGSTTILTALISAAFSTLGQTAQ